MSYLKQNNKILNVFFEQVACILIVRCNVGATFALEWPLEQLCMYVNSLIVQSLMMGDCTIREY